jgi:hypothetical protein
MLGGRRPTMFAMSSTAAESLRRRDLSFGARAGVEAGVGTFRDADG